MDPPERPTGGRDLEPDPVAPDDDRPLPPGRTVAGGRLGMEVPGRTEVPRRVGRERVVERDGIVLAEPDVPLDGVTFRDEGTRRVVAPVREVPGRAPATDPPVWDVPRIALGRDGTDLPPVRSTWPRTVDPGVVLAPGVPRTISIPPDRVTALPGAVAPPERPPRMISIPPGGVCRADGEPPVRGASCAGDPTPPPRVGAEPPSTGTQVRSVLGVAPCRETSPEASAGVPPPLPRPGRRTGGGDPDRPEPDPVAGGADRTGGAVREPVGGVALVGWPRPPPVGRPTRPGAVDRVVPVPPRVTGGTDPDPPDRAVGGRAPSPEGRRSSTGRRSVPVGGTTRRGSAPPPVRGRTAAGGVVTPPDPLAPPRPGS